MAIDVVMTCYFPADAPERQSYARQSLFSLVYESSLFSPSGLRLIVADDSESEQDFVAMDMLPVARREWHNEPIHTHSWHRGIGASLNKALQQVQGLWMYTTDDWALMASLDLTGPSKMLVELGYDVVRLGPVHPDLQCVTRFRQGLGWWLDIRQEYGGFAFATRPFLATKAFYDKIGPFDELQNSYETERLYAERIANRKDIKIAYWGGIDLAGPWEHLGLVEVGYRDV